MFKLPKTKTMRFRIISILIQFMIVMALLDVSADLMNAVSNWKPVVGFLIIILLLAYYIPIWIKTIYGFLKKYLKEGTYDQK